MNTLPQEKEDYIPFGEEWEAHLMKLPKKFIIGLLRKSNLERQEALAKEDEGKGKYRAEFINIDTSQVWHTENDNHTFICNTNTYEKAHFIATAANQFNATEALAKEDEGEEAYVFTKERPANDYNEWQDEDRLFIYDEVSDEWLKKINLKGDTGKAYKGKEMGMKEFIIDVWSDGELFGERVERDGLTSQQVREARDEYIKNKSVPPYKEEAKKMTHEEYQQYEKKTIEFHGGKIPEPKSNTGIIPNEDPSTPEELAVQIVNHPNLWGIYSIADAIHRMFNQHKDDLPQEVARLANKLTECEEKNKLAYKEEVLTEVQKEMKEVCGWYEPPYKEEVDKEKKWEKEAAFWKEHYLSCCAERLKLKLSKEEVDKEPITKLKYEKVFEFSTFQNWVNTAQAKFKKYKRWEGDQSQHIICLDTNGNCLTLGEDFAKAEKEYLFPVTAYLLIRTIETNFLESKEEAGEEKK